MVFEEFGGKKAEKSLNIFLYLKKGAGSVAWSISDIAH